MVLFNSLLTTFVAKRFLEGAGVSNLNCFKPINIKLSFKLSLSKSLILTVEVS